ncbi:MAG: hypothetical protein EBX36_08240 [Planctomycetia bacterium]|nr:hypothetical protein [Planctomycetia bacterium]
MDVTWFAACGRGIGGTDAPAAHPSLAAADYRYAGTSDRLAGVPIAASSSRLFEAEWTCSLAAAPVTSTLKKDGQGTLDGAVMNRLPFPLDRCVLVHAGWLYDVGTLAPGQTFQPGQGRGPRSLAGAVTHRTQNKDREVAVRWDLAERDPLRILELAGQVRPVAAAAARPGRTRRPGAVAVRLAVPDTGSRRRGRRRG